MRASSDLLGPRASRPLFWECQWVWLERDRWSWFVGLPMRAGRQRSQQITWPMRPPVS